MARRGEVPPAASRAEEEPALLTLDVGPVAHGGHCVARADGRVVFVRHALPGERVRARVTGTGGGGRYLRADAVEVLRASADRVPPPCPYARPGRCGGCDWQHADLAAQRALKADVVTEQLTRLAGLEVPVAVEPVPGDRAGLGWRTRVAFAVRGDGRAGLHRYHSHAVEPVDACLIADPAIAGAGVLGRRWPGQRAVEAVTGGDGEVTLLLTPHRGRRRVQGPDPVRRWAAGRWWQTAPASFWQVHPGAPDALVGAVLGMLQPRPGERALDLYAGAGLFAASLAQAVGPQGTVVAVEGGRRVVADARDNLADLPVVDVRHGDVVDVLAAGGLAADVVVLDPPRTGLGERGSRLVAGLRPRAVAYVACDPAALARDLAAFAACGYRLGGLRAFDLFPMTHHVECVALLAPDGRADAVPPAVAADAPR